MTTAEILSSLTKYSMLDNSVLIDSHFFQDFYIFNLNQWFLWRAVLGISPINQLNKLDF